MKKLVIVVLLMFLGIGIAGCSKQEEVKVGFVSNRPNSIMIVYVKAYNRNFDSSNRYYHFQAGGYVQTPTVSMVDLYYTFTGWSQRKQCDVLWDFQHDTVNQDLTLYGCWIPKE